MRKLKCSFKANMSARGAFRPKALATPFLHEIWGEGGAIEACNNGQIEGALPHFLFKSEFKIICPCFSCIKFNLGISLNWLFEFGKFCCSIWIEKHNGNKGIHIQGKDLNFCHTYPYHSCVYVYKVCFFTKK